ncbi:hypothetical protein FHG87_023896 [Trinorchestia longiramus]|nr:hypothetical protein FHG87_023896 [Trinorchestia longiramus]
MHRCQSLLFTECEGGAVTLESHVHNLLHEVHVPSPGRCLAFSCVGAPQLCYRPTSHELPLLLYPLRERRPASLLHASRKSSAARLRCQSGVSSLSSDVRNTGAAEHASLPVLVSNNTSFL